jgi:XTP/dITP diphosphohydrolase
MAKHSPDPSHPYFIMASDIQLRFVSSNKFKIAEAEEILSPHGITVMPADTKIEELQTTDTERLLRDKVLKAFARIGRPLFVEHTGLYVRDASDLPGGLTQIFWDALQAERFAQMFAPADTHGAAIAKTRVAYCDGKQIRQFEGSVAGTIVNPPRGPRDFQWDCVFQPQGDTETFAEMGPRKNAISMRRAAFDKLAKHLSSGRHP